MTIEADVVKRIIKRLLAGEDYRVEVVALIDKEFLEYTTTFFQRVAEAKLINQSVDIDWYKKELLDGRLIKEEVATHSGLNVKTIENMHGTTRKQTVVDASLQHYEELCQSVAALVEKGKESGMDFSIKVNPDVELNTSESLIVINAIAVWRAALAGGLWSSAGKQVEKPLMMTLCALLSVPYENFDQDKLSPTDSKADREVDFYLLNEKEQRVQCEVKLMGRGNPESADGAFARGSHLLVADELSEKMRKSLSAKSISWIEMRNSDVLKSFGDNLKAFGIPYKPLLVDLNTSLTQVFNVIFSADAVKVTESGLLVDIIGE